MNAPNRLIAASEIARRVSLSHPTAAKRLEQCGIAPDFIQAAGQRTFPLYLESRLDELRGLISAPLRPDQAAMH